MEGATPKEKRKLPGGIDGVLSEGSPMQVHESAHAEPAQPDPFKNLAAGQGSTPHYADARSEGQRADDRECPQHGANGAGREERRRLHSPDE